MKSKKKHLIMTASLWALLVPLAVPAEAGMAVPAAVPDSLKTVSPHTPSVSVYYLQELVKEGKMTQEEADRTQQYMIFRHARRQGDLKAVEGMTKEKRRAYMQDRREERGNPLKEYAEYCGFSYERARDLMNAMHASEKGSRYYADMEQQEKK